VTRFLYWNIGRKPLQNLITALVEEHSVDVLILGECEIPPAIMLQALGQTVATFHFAFSPGSSSVAKIFTRFPSDFLHPRFEEGMGRVSIWRMALPARPEILLVAVHLPSKLYSNPESQQQECTEIARSIRDVESNAGHRRTVVVGDFNMNPFEPGIAGAAGFHAVMARHVASRQTRTVQGREYPFFYNPMWSHFGDGPDRPGGTYYYDRSEHVNYFWNIFDQVLLRPELLTRCRHEHVRILTQAGTVELLSEDRRPNQEVASDHLPLFFELDL